MNRPGLGTETGSSPLQLVLNHLSRVQKTLEGYQASCPNPSHGKQRGDLNRSLSIAEAMDGTVLLHCHAGCSVESIVGALGLKLSDLWPERYPAATGNGTRPESTLTLEQLAEAKSLPLEFLKGLGWRDAPGFGVVIPYCDASGRELRRRYRTALKASEGTSWSKSSGSILPYGLNHLASRTGELILVEGETDTATLLYHNRPVLGLPGATTWNVLQLEHVQDFDSIVLVREPDDGGSKFVSGTADRLKALGWSGSVSWISLHPHKDVSDLHRDSPDAEAFSQALNRYLGDRKQVSEASTEPQVPRPLVLTARELLAMELPAREYILAPWLRVKDSVMVYASRGVGKTYFSLGMGVGVAAGGRFLHWEIPEPRKVLLVDGEMAIEELQERLQALIRGSGRDPGSNLRILSVDLTEMGLPSLVRPEGQEIVNSCLQGGELLILDNVSTLMGGIDENEAAAWDPVQRWFLHLRRMGVTVAFVCHAGKSGDQRGSSKKEDMLNSVVKLERPEDYNPVEGARFTVRFTKARGFRGSDVEPFEAWLQDNPDPAVGGSVWLTKRLEDEVQETIAMMRREGASLRDIAKEVGMNHTSVRKRIQKLQDSGDPQ